MSDTDINPPPTEVFLDQGDPLSTPIEYEVEKAASSATERATAKTRQATPTWRQRRQVA